MPPANTSSLTLFSRNKASPFAAAPIRHQACGTSRTVSASAAPSRARTNTSRPEARQDSTSRRGNSPAPATIPTLPVIRPFWLANCAARVGAYEIDDVVDRSDASEALGGFVDAIAQRPVRGEQEMISVAQPLNVLSAETAALHAYDVQATKPRPIAHHLTIRDDVALDAGHAADHGVLTDSDILVDGGKPTEYGIVVDYDVSPEGRVVGHDHIIADLAVMGDMRPHHEQAVVANAGDHPATDRPWVHCHIFADPVVPPDNEFGRLTAVFEVLRFETDRCERKDARVLANRCPAIDHGVRADRDSGGEHHVLADHAVGPDNDIVGKRCPRRYDGRGVDLRHGSLSNRRGSSRRTRPRPSRRLQLWPGLRTSRHCRDAAAW